MSNLLLQDMYEMETYDNYIKHSDFTVQAKFPFAKRRYRQSNKVIPEIVQQQEKDRQEKKKLKLELSVQKKFLNIKRNQSREASERRQMLTNSNEDDINQELWIWYFCQEL